MLIETYLSDEASVGFDIEPIQGGNGFDKMIGTYRSLGKTARFKIEFGPATASPAKVAQDLSIKFGEGRFLPIDGSDASALLFDLQKALQSKSVPRSVANKTAVPFTFAIIGERFSQSPGGGFRSKPTGNWSVIKILWAKMIRKLKYS